MPPLKTNRPKTNELQLGQSSKENTPLPDSVQGPKKVGGPATSSAYNSDRLLEETLNITLKYGDEYMDENPITGAPGAFNLSSTGRKEISRFAIPVTKPLQMPGKVSTAATPTLKTDIAPEKKGNKTDKSPRTPGGKLKRKKSKVGGLASPT
jgi:mediator of RNA polymerase II transcription subunit 6